MPEERRAQGAAVRESGLRLQDQSLGPRNCPDDDMTKACQGRKKKRDVQNKLRDNKVLKYETPIGDTTYDSSLGSRR